MKFAYKAGIEAVNRSGPARDLWIEITLLIMTTDIALSGPARDLWIEILLI